VAGAGPETQEVLAALDELSQDGGWLTNFPGPVRVPGAGRRIGGLNTYDMPQDDPRRGERRVTTMEVRRRHVEAEGPPDAAGRASEDTEESRRQADEDAARADDDGYPLGRRGADVGGERRLAGVAQAHRIIASSAGADRSGSIETALSPEPSGLEAREAALEGIGCIMRLAILGSKATSGPDSAGWFRRITLPSGAAAWGRGPSEEEARRRSVERAEARLAISPGD
jgi:hypothetical protein